LQTDRVVITHAYGTANNLNS